MRVVGRHAFEYIVLILMYFATPVMLSLLIYDFTLCIPVVTHFLLTAVNMYANPQYDYYY